MAETPNRAVLEPGPEKGDATYNSIAAGGGDCRWPSIAVGSIY